MRFGLRTLADVREANKGAYPGFFFMRHALAAIIILHHGRILTRGVREGWDKTGADGSTPPFLDVLTSSDALRPALYALVGGFFALSGFLVAGSALRNPSIKNFLTLRILRLLPALATEITLSAFVLGPLVTTLALSEYFSSGETFSYLLNMVGVIHYTLPGVFVTNPIQFQVNANLWTLDPELACYAILACVMALGLLLHRHKFGLAMLAATVVIVVVLATKIIDIETRMDATRFDEWFIVYLFFAGVLFKCFEDYIPTHFVLFAVSAVAYFLIMLSSLSDVLAGFFLVYCTMYIGTLRFEWFDRRWKWDISYGLYLYGYPITQTIVFFLVPHYMTYNIKSAALIAVLSLVITSAFASLSWVLIERPALGLKKFVGRTKFEIAGVPVPVTDRT